MLLCCFCLDTTYIWAPTRENLSSGVNKDAEQPAHMHAFVIRLLESILSKLGTSKISIF